MAYEEAGRTVYLYEGEAFFDVHADSQQPFVVATPKGTITAIGTAFSVRLDEPAIQITVSEGVVRLSGTTEDETNPSPVASPREQEPATLTAGQSGSFDKALHSIETLEPRKSSNVWPGEMVC